MLASSAMILILGQGASFMTKSRGQVRIIGGEWRGRRLPVPEVPNLRPTPDRVRETLFNWLSGHLPGANCLDLFAGSGVLGFEALSRGAASVVMVDLSPVVITQLKASATLLRTTQADIYQASLPTGLRAVAKPFDLVFLDPPYQSNLLLPCCHYLEQNHFLSDFAYVYLEANCTISDNELPTNWKIVKRQQAGQVVYHLAQRVKP